MEPVLPVVDRVYQLLLEGIGNGCWGGRLPSERQLAAELKVARMTLAKALQRLEAEGCVARSGRSRGRVVVANAQAVVEPKTRQWRIGILVPVEAEDEMEFWRIDRQIIMSSIMELGHTPCVAHMALSNDSPRLGRLEKLMDSMNADAWIVFCGPRVVLEWLDGHRHEPVLAWGGSIHGLRRIPAGGISIKSALLELACEFLALGHRRIVFITSRIHRQPVLSESLVAYRNVLSEAGIQLSDYHLPDWEETPEGLERLLESLFRLTPPTAIILFDEHYASGVLGFLSRQRLEMPDDVSVAVVGEVRSLAWYWPGKQLTGLQRNDDEFVRNITRWIEDQAFGRQATKRYLGSYLLARGNTIGRVKVDEPKRGA
ncbi:GntR family transcriptional regulator [Luteolibacter ambystomatis]|uniref:GntR family transcriptional regulator n=1 Tax=Luteolibacter ambystomatis TaxID=2824561 RepID=A0A975PGK4_9BACT|nr:GntR family transcriptional regulator [Luteolibacter ambystomatis]QUE52660.1 GntR family transcriptional regulator [Luteolibacter ambystomatis]